MYPALKTPKGCLMAADSKRASRSSCGHLLSFCIFRLQLNRDGPGPQQVSTLLFSGKEEKKMWKRKSRTDHHPFLDSESSCPSGWFPEPLPGKARLKKKDPATFSRNMHIRVTLVLEHCSNLQLSLPEPLFGAVCKLRQESLLWLPSRNSKVAERECKEGTMQLYHIYLITCVKLQNWTPECLKQKVDF